MKNSKPPVFLGIDQGTSATKGIVLNLAGEVLQSFRVEVASEVSPNNNVTQDPEELYQSVLSVFHSALKSFSNDYQINSFGLSTQRSGVCAFSSKTQMAVSPLLSWRDRSTLFWIEQLSEENKKLIRSSNSLQLLPDYAGSKIAYFQNEYQESNILIGTLDTYLIFKLSKGQMFCTEHSMAAHTLVYDFKAGNWSKALSEAFGIEVKRLADIRPSHSHFTTLNEIPLKCVLADKQAAVKGIIEHENQAYLDLGSTFSFCFPLKETCFHQGYYTSVLYSDLNCREYFLEAILNCPGHILKQVIEKEGLPAEPEALSDFIEEILSEHKGSAYFPIPSTAAPLWRYGLPCYLSKSLNNNPKHFLKALIEHLSCAMSDCIRQLLELKIINKKISIKTSGGFSKIHYLLQFMADCTGLEFEIINETGGSALGVAKILLKNYKAEHKLTSVKHFEQSFTLIRPASDSHKSKQIYNEWQQLRDQVLKAEVDLERYVQYHVRY